ncbi:MAG: DUF3996 domain-containing protein [Candidatus Vecturithrix sp.]|jgi:hypothetical protein|nr:DUF3996 domain-containing protein [Candidatus Vecturithrix sp.]
MKKFLYIFALLLLFCFVNNQAFAQRQGVGLGVIVGEPTGLSLKSWMSASTALNLAAAWSFEKYGAFQVHLDYVFHHPRLVEPNLPFYYGLGGRLKLKDSGSDDNDAHLGIRLPLGLVYLFREVPLDFFIEVVPVLDLAPETAVNLNAALGMRFYF